MKKKKIKITPYDSAELLTTEETVKFYLEEAFKTNDPTYITFALGTAARARGMSKVAKKTGLSRESLYKALSEKGNPEFSTVLRVLEALGLKFSIKALPAH